MNKIISISVWGDNPRYLRGAERQFELAKEFLPDWEFRVYTDNPGVLKIPYEKMYVPDPGTFGSYWRFMPLFESEDNIVLSRDSDSRFTFREVRAIREWEQSDFKFHIIRDHDSHFQFPIMAGLFGFKGKFDSFTFSMLEKYMYEKSAYTEDQNFLRDFVYPQIESSCMFHTMTSGWFSETRNILKNRFDFCGNGYDENDMPLYPPTLKECVGFDPKDVSVENRFAKGVYE